MLRHAQPMSLLTSDSSSIVIWVFSMIWSGINSYGYHRRLGQGWRLFLVARQNTHPLPPAVSPPVDLTVRPLGSGQGQYGIATEFMHGQVIGYRLSADAAIELDRLRVRTIYIPLHDRVPSLHGDAREMTEHG